MHHSTRAPRSLRGVLLSLLILGLGAGFAAAQDQPTAIVVPVNGTYKLSLAKNITKVFNPKEDVIRVSPVEGDPKSILITGLTPGVATITVTDVDAKDRNYQVVVQYDVEYLKTVLKRAVPTANVEPVPSGNQSVILTGTVAKAEDIQIILNTAASVVGANRVINALQVGGVMTVQLCCTVAQVDRQTVRNMSFTFLETGRKHIVSSTLGLTPTLNALNGPLSVNGGTANVAGGTDNLFLSIIGPNQGFTGFLQALRNESLAKILTEPKLTTSSGRPATFLSGGQQAVPQVSGIGGTAGVQFIPFGTSLTFLPIVLGNGKIYLEVQPEITLLGGAGGTNLIANGASSQVSGRTTQSVKTAVELEPGQTLAIGGLIQQQESGATTKIPILGDLPWVGAAFRNVAFSRTETELVILVTPYLVDGMSINQVPKILPGQETRQPDDYELFLEGILEAPRGSRVVCPGGKYVPAFKNGPSAGAIPCAGGNGACGANGGCCGTEPLGGVVPPNGQPAVHPAPVAAPAPMEPPLGDNGLSGQRGGLSAPGSLPAAVGGELSPSNLPPARLGVASGGTR